jgi:hypothetical protein
MEERYYAALDATVALIECGWNVFSPIVHSHYIGRQMKRTMDSAFWVRLDLSYLERWADILFVLCIEGYWQSFGVAKEIECAWALGLPVAYSSDRGEFVLMKKLCGGMWE